MSISMPIVLFFEWKLPAQTTVAYVHSILRKKVSVVAQPVGLISDFPRLN